MRPGTQDRPSLGRARPTAPTPLPAATGCPAPRGAVSPGCSMTTQPLPTQKHTQEVQSSRTWSSALEALEAGRLDAWRQRYPEPAPGLITEEHMVPRGHSLEAKWGKRRRRGLQLSVLRSSSPGPAVAVQIPSGDIRKASCGLTSPANPPPAPQHSHVHTQAHACL